jgi:hypothetical protein
MEKKPAGDRPVTSGPLKPAVAREIDENLKRVYRETLDEPVPDRFRDLLDALRKKEGNAG